jgi:hypothetical protein
MPSMSAESHAVLRDAIQNNRSRVKTKDGRTSLLCGKSFNAGVIAGFAKVANYLWWEDF